MPNPENLKPIQKGEVRNPKGHNQYTYRRVFEDAIDTLLTTASKEQPRKKLAEVLAEKALDMASKGDHALMREVLARLWPQVSKHELSGDVTVEGADPAALADRLAELARSRRPNGHDREADAE